MVQQVFTATGSWTCPDGVTQVLVECYGGGGAGGSGSVSGAAGGGGAGGCYVRKFVTVAARTVYTVTVGAGGIAQTAPTVDGATRPGGDSWFSTSGTVIAKGGAGGGDRATSGNGTAGTGSSTGCIGDSPFTFAGGSGAAGATATIGGGGGGGAGTSDVGDAASGSTAGTKRDVDGGAGSAGTSAADAVDGSVYGGGGGGARATSTTDRIGGDGAAGKVVVRWIAPGNPIGQATVVGKIASTH